MPLENDLNKVLVLGSGPNIVGNVAEMDVYTEAAIRAFQEEDVHVVLVNPNPATVAGDRQKGVTVYLEPMTLSFMKRILRMEEPDAIVTAYGSTNGLKVAKELVEDGIIQEMGIKLMTTNTKLLNILSHKDQIAFLQKHKFPTSESWHLEADKETILDHLNQVNFPVLVTKYHQYIRNEHFKFQDVKSLESFFKQESMIEQFKLTNYRLTEDLSDWEEIIVDVIRDNNGNFNFLNIASCIESVSINSGDSFIVAPALTLNNDHVRQLRKLTKKVMNSLNVKGFLSIHFAVSHSDTSIKAKILTIKERLTRSSLLSKRVGMYDVGYVLAKIALGYNLNEIVQPLTGLNAAIEPVLDVVAVKAPYFSFNESGLNHYKLSDRMRSSGESINIGRNFEAAFLKSLDSCFDLHLFQKVFFGELKKSNEEILADLSEPNEQHLIITLAAIYQGIDYVAIHEVTRIHPIFFEKLSNIIKIIKQLQASFTLESLKMAKKYGFSDVLISLFTNKTGHEIEKIRHEENILPAYLSLDGSSGLYPAKYSVCYSAYDCRNEISPITDGENKVLIIGMHPIQVSLTSEYDYMLYHAIKTLKANNIKTILISNNPEAVSTAYELVDRTYFEPITISNIREIVNREGIKQVLTQFSGKEVNQMRADFAESGLEILGQGDYSQQIAGQVLNINDSNIAVVPHAKLSQRAQAIEFSKSHGFPVLIGGKANKIKLKSAVVYDIPALEKYIDENNLDEITISSFIEGRKYEVTAISDGKEVTIPGIIEHLEQTGSHASDSIAVFKPQNLTSEQMSLLVKVSQELISKFEMPGMFNLHFLYAKKRFFILQVKTYAGHNLAFLSKSLNKDLVAITTKCLLGQSLKEQGIEPGIWNVSNLIHVKMPVFSYIGYESDNTFDSKMKSSGSVMGRDTQLSKALFKGYEGSNLNIPSYGTIFISVRDEDKQNTIALAKRFHRLGFKLVATEGTATILAEAGITTGIVKKVQEDQHNLLEKIASHKIVMVINITNLSDNASHDAIQIRDQALSTHIPVFSSLQTAKLILAVLESLALTTQPI
ncbi:carbamoyl phosphate synthase large subunit [Lactobacillus psittaci]|uniref:Carbamoyl phosphate synthase large subunit n=1 Tax=Lactobacillus psittaci DSM 15354 TaxID=1122152 RepID=A0A0R1S7U4_9LACO|nr:carbamoyl phosphate synthase large subunit [Lactobacillus psittaci]KRL63620.1 carbamoyl phosphate synthase large subunit [Lactobacillus psittaci DSM 15354]